MLGKVKELPLLLTVAAIPTLRVRDKLCCCATPPSAAGIKLNLFPPAERDKLSKKITVKKACGTLPAGLLPFGCTAFTNPLNPPNCVVIFVAFPFTRLLVALPPLMAGVKLLNTGILL